MGFFFRKSLRLGPVRLNLSKSGVGVSGGIRGARVGIGTRGPYVAMAKGGLVLPEAPWRHRTRGGRAAERFP